ncbi:MAG: 3'-5' exoribonuclease [Candidatus Accumulibacter sp.]|jgi:DNA polymerase-3 subunit epsilon|nr:3'-5' exoribonuclease [Accumulibacter sp.]
MSTFLAQEALVFVDLETTGANFMNDRIIEIGLVEVTREGVLEWSTLVDPGRPVPPFITALTGVDTAMLASAPAFAQLASELLERLRGRLFVAHNARFDYGFLRHEFKRNGIDFRATRLCTVKLSRALFPGHRRHNLDTLVERFGMVTGDRHRALADARVLWDLWRHWHALLPAETIAGAVDRIIGRPELPPQIDPALLDDLPEAHGAYAVFGEDGALLAARRAVNLRQQVCAHFSPDRRELPQVRAARRIEWREAAGELGARLGELELSAARRRPSGEPCSWRLIRRGDGGFLPALVFSGDTDFAHTEDLFGLYRSPREAILALRKLAEAHGVDLQFDGAKVLPGKGAGPLQGARLIAALARYCIRPWPYPGPIALIERDDFGMREDAHVILDWGYLGTAGDAATLRLLLEKAAARDDSERPRFDAEIYRIVGKFLREGRLAVIDDFSGTP